MSALVPKRALLVLFLLQQNLVEAKKLSKSESWGYGILVGITIGACGFLGACMVLGCRKSKKVNIDSLNKMLISFAIGTLIGDAFIHLIPKAFSPPSKDSGDDSTYVSGNVNDASQKFSSGNSSFYNSSDASQEHTHEHNEGELTEETAKILSAMLCLGYFVFFVIENFMHIVGHHTHSHSHSHSHGNECEKHEKQQTKDEHKVNNKSSLNQDQAIAVQSQNNGQSDQNSVGNQNEMSSPEKVKQVQEQQFQNQQIAVRETETEFQGQRSERQLEDNEIHLDELTTQKERNKVPGFLNLFSDFIHNILDGLAIGVAFADGNSKMIFSTFIAVLAHEIPQEVGDAGILLNSGFTPKQVLFSNGFVNFSALIGTLIGLGVGQINEEATLYLYAFIAANFIYIAASDMLPQIIEESKVKFVIIHGFLMLLGMGIMWAVLEIEAVTGGED